MKWLILAALCVGIAAVEGETACGDDQAPAHGPEPAGPGFPGRRGEKRGGVLVLRPARVFDGVGTKAHEGWVVVVRGDRIDSAGPEKDIPIPAGARVLSLPGTTLLPGLIDA